MIIPYVARQHLKKKKRRLQFCSKFYYTWRNGASNNRLSIEINVQKYTKIGRKEVQGWVWGEEFVFFTVRVSSRRRVYTRGGTERKQEWDVIGHVSAGRQWRRACARKKTRQQKSKAWANFFFFWGGVVICGSCTREEARSIHLGNSMLGGS